MAVAVAPVHLDRGAVELDSECWKAAAADTVSEHVVEIHGTCASCGASAGRPGALATPARRRTAAVEPGPTAVDLSRRLLASATPCRRAYRPFVLKKIKNMVNCVQVNSVVGTSTRR